MCEQAPCVKALKKLSTRKQYTLFEVVVHGTVIATHADHDVAKRSFAVIRDATSKGATTFRKTNVVVS